MRQKKILIVTGTRAEYGLLRSTMDAIVAHPRLELKLLVTGIHTLKTYGNTAEQITNDGYTVAFTVSVQDKNTMPEMLAVELAGISQYLEELRPDCVLVLGDRDEPFAAAVAAAHLGIPVAHIHGGDVSGPGVDELLRHAITKLSHLHFPGTHKSALRIKALGEESWRITDTGSVCLDILTQGHVFSREEVAQKLGLDVSRPWFVVLHHATALDTTASVSVQIASVLDAAAAFPEFEKIVIYPNSDTGSDVFIKKIEALKGERYHVHKSLPRELFVGALKGSDALVGNSSAGIIEAALLGTPTINVGNRQLGREASTSVLHVSYDTKKIATAIKKAVALNKKQKGKPFASPYGKGGVGKKIAEVLAKQLDNPKLMRKKPPVA